MAHWLILPDGTRLLCMPSPTAAAVVEARMRAREEFALRYMREKNWGEDFQALSIYQVIEIRMQTGWQDPLNEAN
jgi:hypothetical protein